MIISRFFFGRIYCFCCSLGNVCVRLTQIVCVSICVCDKTETAAFKTIEADHGVQRGLVRFTIRAIHRTRHGDTPMETLHRRDGERE